MPMPKPNLSSASLDALLKLRDEIEEVLTHRAALLREELSRLGHQIGSKGKAGRSSQKGRKVPVKYRDKSGNTWAGRGAHRTGASADVIWSVHAQREVHPLKAVRSKRNDVTLRPGRPMAFTKLSRPTFNGFEFAEFVEFFDFSQLAGGDMHGIVGFDNDGTKK